MASVRQEAPLGKGAEMYNMYEVYEQILADKARNNPLSASVSAQPVGSRFRDRIARRIGNLLISAGQKLHERYEPATYPAPEVRPSTAGKASV
jgi:hypothetical protein